MIFNLTDWKPISRGYLNNINVNMDDEVLFIKTNSAESSGELIQVNFNTYSRWARWMDIRFGTTIQWSIINCDNNRNKFSNLPSDINKEWMIAKKIDRLVVKCNGIKVLEFMYATARKSDCKHAYGRADLKLHFGTSDSASDF